MKKDRWLGVAQWLLLLGVLGLTGFLYVERDQIRNLGVYGYPGIFVLSLISNATVILPLPGVVLTSAMGAVFNPFWVAVAAGSGATLGELSGYLAGYSGRAVADQGEWNQRVDKLLRRVGLNGFLGGVKQGEDTTKVDWRSRLQILLKRFGGFAIFFLALIPNPFFDMAGIFAGALQMPVWQFLLWAWLGKIIKMMVFAYGGATILGWFQ